MELISWKKPVYDNGYHLTINFRLAYMIDNSGKALFDKELSAEDDIDVLEDIGKLAVMCIRELVDETNNGASMAMPLQDRLSASSSSNIIVIIIACMVVPMAAGGASPPNCQHKCGGVPIPYPFGIGDGCSFPGYGNEFQITCNNNSLVGRPPRPYLFGKHEIMDVAVEAAEIRIYEPVSYICFKSINQLSAENLWEFDSSSSPLLISPKKNKFVGLGCYTDAMLSGREDETYYTTCASYCPSENQLQVGEGRQCTGLGCCETPYITTNLSYMYFYFFENDNETRNPAWKYSPCSYAFMADISWYVMDSKISREDVIGNMTFVRRIGKQGVPLVLDWAIRDNGTCLTPSISNKNGKEHGNTCVSVHSYCLNTTNGPGYICKCSEGYAGNPYVSDGCQNVNECDPSIYNGNYPCIGGTCQDIEGGYRCKCNFGRRKDGKDGHTCNLVLPKQAIVAIGNSIRINPAFATICAISILAILLIFLHMKREKRKLQYAFDKNGGQLLKNIGIRIFTKKEMDKITNNYDTKIGEGNFGRVYMGTTDDKQKVAVKCPRPDTKHNTETETVNENRPSDFANEITVQFRINHKNVVRLLGCCLETNAPQLVYEFIPKGSLEKVLHGESNGSNLAKDPLPLQVRLEIAIQSAEALNYMHSSANQKILHGDVKPGNILLDDNFMPKVSDFGISRLLPIGKKHTSLVIGDPNYIDPEYMETGLLTQKSDVYGFGIVLLELITRKAPRYDDHKRLTIVFVKTYMTEKKAREMFDEEITTSTEAINCLDMISGIAVECLQQGVDERPTMKEVLERLRSAKEVMQGQR
uniref:Protein kinase domain-containing protein n=1 Tax=Leersia perrieri TaxID=77586 RepID=A0A0D9XT47_9ORYZ